VNKGKGEGESLTWLHVDSDDVPGCLCHIPWKKCALMWCCHVVIVVGCVFVVGVVERRLQGVVVGGSGGDAVGWGGG